MYFPYFGNTFAFVPNHLWRFLVFFCALLIQKHYLSSSASPRRTTNDLKAIWLNCFSNQLIVHKNHVTVTANCVTNQFWDNRGSLHEHRLILHKRTIIYQTFVIGCHNRSIQHWRQLAKKCNCVRMEKSQLNYIFDRMDAFCMNISSVTLRMSG